MKRLSNDEQRARQNNRRLIGRLGWSTLGLLLMVVPALAAEWKPARPAKPRETTIERLPTANFVEETPWQAASAPVVSHAVAPITSHVSEPEIIRTGAVVPVSRPAARVTHALAPVGPILDRPMQATSHVMPFAEDEIVPTPQPQPQSRTTLQPQPQPSATMNSMPAEGEIIYDNGTYGGDGAYGGSESYGQPIMDGGSFIDGMDGFPMMGGCGPDGCGGGDCGGDACDGGLDPMLYDRFGACSLLSFLNELYMSAGVQGFKGPLDQGRVGNFGFNQALNVSDSLWHRMGVGYQLGARFAESNFNGDMATGTASASTRTQTFITGGFFHRAFYNRGLQYGIVADYLNDNYYDDFDMVQLRYEMSYITCRGNEFGYWGTGGTQSWPFVINGINRTAVPVDQNAFFFRRNMNNGGGGRLWAGFTGTHAAMFGGDVRVPVSNRFDMTTNFNYLIPTQGGANGGVAEGWGLGINFVFYPGRPKKGRGPHVGPYRALFGVADNATFMTYQTTP